MASSTVKFFVVENVVYDYNVSNLLCCIKDRGGGISAQTAKDMVEGFYYFNPTATYSEQDQQTLVRTYLKNPDVKTITPNNEAQRYFVFNKFGLSAWLKDTREFGPMHRVATMLNTGQFSPQQLVYSSSLYGENYIVTNPITYSHLLNSVFGFNAWFVVHVRYAQWTAAYLNALSSGASNKRRRVASAAAFAVLPKEAAVNLAESATKVLELVTDASTVYGDIFSSGNMDFLFKKDAGETTDSACERMYNFKRTTTTSTTKRLLRQALADRFLQEEYRRSPISIEALPSTLSDIEVKAVLRFVDLGERFFRSPNDDGAVRNQCEHVRQTAVFKKTCRLSTIARLLTPPRNGIIHCKKCHEPMICIHWLDTCNGIGTDGYVHFYNKDTGIAVCKYCGEGLEGSARASDSEPERLIVGFDESTSGVLNEMYGALRKVAGQKLYNVKSIVYNALPTIKHYVDLEFNNNKFEEISEQVLYTVISYCYIYATFKDTAPPKGGGCCSCSSSREGGASIRSVLKTSNINGDDTTSSSSVATSIVVADLMKSVRSVIFSKLVKDKNIQKFLNSKIEVYYNLFRSQAIHSQVTNISNEELVQMNLVDSVSFRNCVLEYLSFIRFVSTGEKLRTMTELLGATTNSTISAFTSITEMPAPPAVPSSPIDEEVGVPRLISDYNLWVGHFHNTFPVILSSKEGEHIRRHAYYSTLQKRGGEVYNSRLTTPLYCIAYVIGDDHIHVWKVSSSGDKYSISCSICGIKITDTVNVHISPSEITTEKLLSEYHIVEMSPSPRASSTGYSTEPAPLSPLVPIPIADGGEYKFISIVEKELNIKPEILLSIGFVEDESGVSNATECEQVHINVLYTVYNYVMSVLSAVIQSSTNKKEIHEKMQAVREIWNSNKHTLNTSKDLYCWLVDVLCESVLYYEKDVLALRRFFGTTVYDSSSSSSTPSRHTATVIDALVDSSQILNMPDVFDDENANLVTTD